MNRLLPQENITSTKKRFFFRALLSPRQIGVIRAIGDLKNLQ